MLTRQIVRYVCIAIVVVVFFFPIYWMMITSMKPQEEVLYYPPTFVPPELTFRYYVEAFDFRGGTALINSLIITSIVTIISTVLGTLGGYAFARYKVGGFHLPFWILSTRMMPQVRRDHPPLPADAAVRSHRSLCRGRLRAPHRDPAVRDLDDAKLLPGDAGGARGGGADGRPPRSGSS